MKATNHKSFNKTLLKGAMMAVLLSSVPTYLYADTPDAKQLATSNKLFETASALQLKNRQAQIDQLKSVLEQKEDKLEVLIAQLDKKDTLKEQHQKLKQELQEKLREREALKAKIKVLEDNADFTKKREAEFDAIFSEMEQILTDQDELRSQNTDYEEKLKAEEDKTKRLAQDLHVAREEYIQAQKAFVELQKETELSLEEGQGLKIKVQDFEAQRLKDQQQLSALMERNKQLELILNDVARREAVQQKVFEEELARREAMQQEVFAQEIAKRDQKLQDSRREMSKLALKKRGQQSYDVNMSGMKTSQNKAGYFPPLPVRKPSLSKDSSAVASKSSVYKSPSDDEIAQYYRQSYARNLRRRANEPSILESESKNRRQYSSNLKQGRQAQRIKQNVQPPEALQARGIDANAEAGAMRKNSYPSGDGRAAKSVQYGNVSSHLTEAQAMELQILNSAEDMQQNQARIVMNLNENEPQYKTSIFPTEQVSISEAKKEKIFEQGAKALPPPLSIDEIDQVYDPNFGVDQTVYYAPSVDIYGLLQGTYGYVPKTFGLLKSASNDKNLVYQWNDGEVYSSAIQKPIDNADFDALTKSYLLQTEKRCRGDFAALPVDSKDIGNMRVDSFDIACIMGEQKVNAAAAIVFFSHDNTFSAVSHESSTDIVDRPMGMREQIINTFERTPF